MPGKTILFNLEGPDNVSSLRVPYSEVLSLEDYWVQPFDFGKVLVVNYTAVEREIDLKANPKADKTTAEQLMKDINSVRSHRELLVTDEGPGNLMLETIGPLGDLALDYIVSSNGRADAQIQDYKPAWRKVASILGTMMSMDLNVVLTGHLKSDKDEITGRSRQVPNVFGEVLPGLIPKMFGEVFQSLVISGGGDKVKYVWQTRPDPGGFIGYLGTRKLPDERQKFIDQDFGVIAKLIKEVKK